MNQSKSSEDPVDKIINNFDGDGIGHQICLFSPKTIIIDYNTTLDRELQNEIVDRDLTDKLNHFEKIKLWLKKNRYSY